MKKKCKRSLQFFFLKITLYRMGYLFFFLFLHEFLTHEDIITYWMNWILWKMRPSRMTQQYRSKQWNTSCATLPSCHVTSNSISHFLITSYFSLLKIQCHFKVSIWKRIQVSLNHKVRRTFLKPRNSPEEMDWPNHLKFCMDTPCVQLFRDVWPEFSISIPNPYYWR